MTKTKSDDINYIANNKPRWIAWLYRKCWKKKKIRMRGSRIHFNIYPFSTHWTKRHTRSPNCIAFECVCDDRSKTYALHASEWQIAIQNNITQRTVSYTTRHSSCLWPCSKRVFNFLNQRWTFKSKDKLNPMNESPFATYLVMMTKNIINYSRLPNECGLRLYHYVNNNNLVNIRIELSLWWKKWISLDKWDNMTCEAVTDLKCNFTKDFYPGLTKKLLFWNKITMFRSFLKLNPPKNLFTSLSNPYCTRNPGRIIIKNGKLKIGYFFFGYVCVIWNNFCFYSA